MTTEVTRLESLIPTINSSPSSNSLNQLESLSTLSVASVSANKSSEQSKTVAVAMKNLAVMGQAMAAELQAEKAPAALADSELTEAADFVNRQMQNYARNLEFSVEEETGELIVRVYDSESEELVRQIPSEDMVELVRRLQEQDEASSNPIEGLLLKVTA